ncbi:hypothetical protein EDD15DRAFT_348613 [Pisolithus albus]|nr:hypothetical protein EDD15DRAFT_348613 [Pisolithus albus]
MMNADPPSDISSVCGTEEDGLLPHSPTLSRANSTMRYNLLRGSRQPSAVQLDARHEVAFPQLHGRCRTLHTQCDTPHRYAAEGLKAECEWRSIMQTLSAGLRGHVIATLNDLSCEREGATTVPANIDYDKQLDTPSMVQEIEALQVKLDALEDEDEQRALEEDITGKARIVSSFYFSMLRVVHSFIDPVALLVWDLRRS